MSTFLEGFKSAAVRKKQPEGMTEGQQAAAVGAGTTGALAAGSSIKEYAKDVMENRSVKASRTIEHLKKQMRPGDIVLSGASLKNQDLINLKGVKLPVRIGELVQLLSGSHHYHGAVYGGKNKLYQAYGVGHKFGPSDLEYMKGDRMKVYRPTGASKREVTDAVKYVKQTARRHAPYKNELELVGQGARYLLDPTGGPGVCRKAGDKIVCNTAVTKAYPKQFKKELMMPNEIRNTKGMKLVARYGRAAEPTLREKVWTRAVSPVLRNAKWGLMAGAAAYGGKKIYDAVTDKKRA